MKQVDSVEATTTNSVIAGCVAVSLYGVTACVAWFINGAPEEALGQIAVGGVVVFTVMTAIRGFGGLLRRQPANVAIAVVTDVALLLACMLMILLVQYLAGGGGYALYGILIMAGFLVPTMLVVSACAEIATRQVWVARTSVAVAGSFGIVSLVIYAVNLTS